MLFSGQPAKLSDCHEHGLGSDAELFIVEGDSAAQSVARIRDERFQAVLPMQGKPMNALKAAKNTLRRNPFFNALIDSIGTDIGESFDLSACRYQKIILLFDPDADGIHCGTLALLFFYRWMRPLLEAGNVAIVRAPMMHVVADKLGIVRLAYSEEEGQRICNELSIRQSAGVIKRRFRGLASLNVETLQHCCIEPASRKLFQLTTRDAESSIELMSLMKRPPRKPNN
jgi:DNA gyrase/topoisomerase IV subunit B